MVPLPQFAPMEPSWEPPPNRSSQQSECLLPITFPSEPSELAINSVTQRVPQLPSQLKLQSSASIDPWMGLLDQLTSSETQKLFSDYSRRPMETVPSISPFPLEEMTLQWWECISSWDCTSTNLQELLKDCRDWSTRLSSCRMPQSTTLRRSRS